MGSKYFTGLPLKKLNQTKKQWQRTYLGYKRADQITKSSAKNSPRRQRLANDLKAIRSGHVYQFKK